jgi:hypothetical protein
MVAVTLIMRRGLAACPDLAVKPVTRLYEPRRRSGWDLTNGMECAWREAEAGRLDTIEWLIGATVAALVLAILANELLARR